MLAVVDYVREMTAKKSCEYGKHGSFEHLLFLFPEALTDIASKPIIQQIMESQV